MIWMIAVLSLAGQPGEEKDVYEVSLRGVPDPERTVVLGAGLRARIDADAHWYAAVEGDLLPGMRNDLLGTVNAIAQNQGNLVAVPEGRTLDGQFRLAVGAHTANTDREAGFRGSAGVVAAMYDNSGSLGWVQDVLFLSATHWSEILGGLELFGGWAVPLGDDVGDPLLVVGGRGSTELPITAWGASLQQDPAMVLGASGVRSRAGLVQPRARMGATFSLTYQHLRVSADVGMLIRSRSAASRNSVPGADGTSEHPDLSFAVGAIF